MAAVVPFASCYAGGSQPLQLFGKGPAGSNYLSLLAYRGPRCAPRPRLTCHAPKMTLRQICRLLRMMKQVKKRETSVAAARKQGTASPAPSSPGSKAEKKCPPCCLRYKRSIKRIS
ncbi:hypothetical protein FQA47_019007 [Oryzias melastigma]|uniref:Uncharacterized protein n=1 Tax=Oryzias melastigma TaxID=30732 RepID=A0A834KYH4_ORYME|nr:hypothetical protein FQA47_019007 [Oryzias melastigma]